MVLFHLYTYISVALVTIALFLLLTIGGTIKFNFEKFNPTFEKIDNILK